MVVRDWYFSVAARKLDGCGYVEAAGAAGTDDVQRGAASVSRAR